MDPGKTSSDENTKVILAKLEYDHQLARLGLQGTLWGALASLAAIVTIVIAEVATERYVVQGLAFAAMVGLIVISVTAYGAFIFDRALTVSAKVDKEGHISLLTRVRGKDATNA
jgi:hypothetical protein